MYRVQQLESLSYICTISVHGAPDRLYIVAIEAEVHMYITYLWTNRYACGMIHHNRLYQWLAWLQL